MSFYKFQFTQSPLKNELHRMRIENSRILQEALRNNLTGFFFDDLDWRNKHKRNANIKVKGEQGSGKSTGARVIKIFNDQTLEVPTTVDDILFDRLEFTNRFKTAQPGQTMIIDEDFDFATQVGAYRIRESVRFIEQTIRQRQISVISCMVSDTPHLYNYELEAFDIDYEMSLNRCLLLDETNFGSQPIGFILLDRKTIPPFFERAYEVKKEAFLDKVQKQTHRAVFETLTAKVEESLTGLDLTKKLSRSFFHVLLRKNNSEVAETELNQMVEIALYENELVRQKITKTVKNASNLD